MPRPKSPPNYLWSGQVEVRKRITFRLDITPPIPTGGTFLDHWKEPWQGTLTWGRNSSNQSRNCSRGREEEDWPLPSASWGFLRKLYKVKPWETTQNAQNFRAPRTPVDSPPHIWLQPRHGRIQNGKTPHILTFTISPIAFVTFESLGWQTSLILFLFKWIWSLDLHPFLFLLGPLESAWPLTSAVSTKTVSSMAKSVHDTLLEQKDRNGRVLLTEASLQAEPAE